MACGGAMRQRNMARRRRFVIGGGGGGERQTPLVRVQPRTGSLRPDDGSAGRRGRRPEDGDDRRDLSQGTPHGDQPAVEKGRPGDRRGRLISRSSRGTVRWTVSPRTGGMNTKLQAVTDADGRPIRFSGDWSSNSDGRPSQRRHGCGSPAGQRGKGGVAAGRPGP